MNPYLELKKTQNSFLTVHAVKRWMMQSWENARNSSEQQRSTILSSTAGSIAELTADYQDTSIAKGLHNKNATSSIESRPLSSDHKAPNGGRTDNPSNSVAANSSSAKLSFSLRMVSISGSLAGKRWSLARGRLLYRPKETTSQLQVQQNNIQSF